MEIVHSEKKLNRYFTRAQNFVPGQTNFGRSNIFPELKLKLMLFVMAMKY
jgi:hypothetical protein